MAFRLALLAGGGFLTFFCGYSAYVCLSNGRDVWNVLFAVLFGLGALFGAAISCFAVSERPVPRRLPGFRLGFACSNCGATLPTHHRGASLASVTCSYCRSAFDLRGYADTANS